MKQPDIQDHQLQNIKVVDVHPIVLEAPPTLECHKEPVAVILLLQSYYSRVQTLDCTCIARFFIVPDRTK